MGVTSPTPMAVEVVGKPAVRTPLRAIESPPHEPSPTGPGQGASQRKVIAAVVAATFVSCVGVSLSAVDFYRDDILARTRADSLVLASSKAGEIRAMVGAMVEKGNAVGRVLYQGSPDASGLLAGFSLDRDVIAVQIYKKDATSTYHPTKFWRNPSTDTAELELRKTLETPGFSIEQVAGGALRLGSFVMDSGKVFITVSFPIVQAAPDDFSVIATVIGSEDSIRESLGDAPPFSAVLVDKQGTLVADSDIARIKKHESLASNPLVKHFLESTGTREFLTFQNGTDEYLGSYASIGLGGGAVITSVRRSQALSGADRFAFRAGLICAFALSASFILAYLAGMASLYRKN